MRFPLFGVGMQGKSPVVTAKRIQNMFCEIRPAGEKSLIVAYPTPGLTLFSNFGDTPIRGMIVFEATDLLYVVHRGTLWEVNNAGVATSRGMLNTTTGRVSMAHNGLQIMIVDGTNGYTYNTSSTTFAQISDVDFPANPVTVTFQDSYFIVNKSGSQAFYLSDSNDGTAWTGTMTSNADSNPDPIVATIADHGQLILFGSVSTEFWVDTGASNFPYARVTGSPTEYGLAATWSLTKFNDSLAGVFKSRDGLMVGLLNGYQPQKISTPDLDALMTGYSTVSDATAFAYRLNGHSMLQLNFPTAGVSWLYDSSTGIWHPLKSANIGRHRAEIGLSYLNQTVVSDYTNGKLYKLQDGVYTDNGDMIEREMVSENIVSPDGERFNIDRVRVDMQTGVGLATGQGSDPIASMSISKDGGQSWGRERFASIGKVGQTLTRAEWGRWGQTRQANFKLRVTDPVKVVVTNAMLNPAD